MTKLTHDQRMAKLSFWLVYPMYLEKIEKKWRTKAELLEIIEWLTWCDEIKIDEFVKNDSTFEEFFRSANLKSQSRAYNLNYLLIQNRRNN